MNVLNKKSGVEGLSGISSDFRDLEKAADEGNARAEAAQKCFSYAVAKYVGAYAAAMGGVDVVAFTAGVGENDSVIRAMVGKYLGFLGIKIDPEKNNCRGVERVISTDDSKALAMIVPTNEELAIARETVEILK